MVTVTTSWNSLTNTPTIYQTLKVKLGREPTHAELCADVRRIMTDAMIDRAGQGKLKFQRGRI